MKKFKRAIAALFLSAVPLSFGATPAALAQAANPGGGGESGNGERALVGTIWVAKEPHRRVTVTTEGDIDIKEGKDIYVRFLEQVDDLLIIEVRWWNVAANLNVLEHGVMARITPNIYRYIEADQDNFGVPNASFPGIIGRGTFELQGKNRAKLIQIGHLIDGSASGFTTVLERTDELPEVPIDQTYP